MNYVEILGYVASIVVAISLTMSKILKLRIFNLIGSTVFAVYAFLISAYPVFAVNTFIAIINIYYLVKMYKNKDLFEILNVVDNFEYLEKFLIHYKSDIEFYFPKINPDIIKNNKVLFILRNMRPVNLVVYNQQNNGIVEILVDYTIPEYRDFLNGKYLLNIFKDSKVKIDQLVVNTESEKHTKYLRKLGFSKNDAGLFVRKV